MHNVLQLAVGVHVGLQPFLNGMNTVGLQHAQTVEARQ